eukprot:m.95070 g.95070  ORF g.95070 m.95070 type:complete len:301 (+) comp15141_c1_seq2:193-1095(+)
MAPKKAASAIVLPVLFVGWYACSFFTDMLNKKVQKIKRVPISLTAVQFVCGTVCSGLLLYVFKVQPTKLSATTLRKVSPVAVCWIVGFLTTNYSLGMGNMSFAHSVKATEPLFLVALSLLFFNQGFTTSVYLSLVPIVVGIALVATNELNFSLPAFVSVCIANICFPLRSIFARQLIQAKVVNNLGLFFQISLLASVVTIPLALFTEGAELVGNTKWLTRETVVMVILNGVLHYSYNQLSFLVLSRVGSLSHSIGNASRRFVIIMCSVWYFGTYLSPLNQLGIVLLVIGVFSYVWARSRM